MREILFRGKRCHTGEWIEGYVYRVIEKQKTPFLMVKDMHAITYEVDAETIGQYTGLEDKNGQRIFEGDIVKCSHTIHNPEEDQHVPRRAYDFHEEKSLLFGFSTYVYLRNYEVRNVKGIWVLRNGCDGHNLTESYIHWHNIEVIGNIHDNPELLKEPTA